MKYKVKLVKLPEKVLREKSQDVNLPLSQEDIDLAEKMIYHITTSQTKENTEFQPGVGVAAVQYGILKNMFYIRAENIRFSDSAKTNGDIVEILDDVLINPKVIATSETYLALENGEGCLSVGQNIPHQAGFVHRKSRILIEAFSYREKKFKKYDLRGYLAIVAQHEFDHLQGTLFLDHIDNYAPWEKINDCKYITEGEL